MTGEADTQELQPYILALGRLLKSNGRPSLLELSQVAADVAHQQLERVSLDAQQALLDRLDKEIFYSKADPAGQYVKDCISEERTKLEKERNLLCQQNS